MSVPNFSSFMRPILELLADGQTRHWREVRDAVLPQMGLSAEDVEDRSSGTGRPVVDTRVQWAITYLAQAGLLSRPSRGTSAITDSGSNAVSSGVAVDREYLLNFESFRDFLQRTGTRYGNRPSGDASSVDQHAGEGASSGISDESPEELADRAERENRAALTGEVLARVLAESPDFMERLVVKLLSAMGYAGTGGEAIHTGQSGDGGVDGVISRDPLGLDRVFMQAKRYAADHVIGRPDIQAFVGALHGLQADRGVFLTTSRFSREAIEYARGVQTRVILIDGAALANLMIEHEVGVQATRSFELKSLDEDFFDTL